MYYSLTFTVEYSMKNTWTDWGLIPTTPPMIPNPEPNVTYVDVPGRSGGPIDLTKAIFNKNTYKRMTGSWSFYKEIYGGTIRKDLYEELRAFFLGKTGKVILEEDSTHYYVGRFSVGVPQTGTGPMQITISFDLAPVRYLVADDSVDTDYAPD